MKKLAKADRREQLLETARSIMREEGTASLTLGRLAERAGVSKPIAYEHFGTRAGLLMALCGVYDEEQTQAQRAALAAGGNSLRDVVAILSAAYLDCALSMGPEVGAAFAALAATEEMAEYRQALREGHMAEYRSALSPYVDLPDSNGDAILAGLLGAGETLSQDAAAGRITREEAVAALTAIFTGTLERYAPATPGTAAG
ncbi:TetR/AcrR family transcriptional regulator [Mesorhizobium sp. L-8-3]|uniref:TetR/AcrR family transcriptional regulator n=1 Tax=Mesorhizobium sp. L-8-3 TaxID=2744522 RepID=UPI001938E598|nr:TetR/AcrR family transcriptional regulator [Mesorhizobium sp. L-8-3]BCH23805.1 TetR family transcriptional regulator [Mesorhizobium sp. L-8-3]